MRENSPHPCSGLSLQVKDLEGRDGKLAYLTPIFQLRDCTAIKLYLRASESPHNQLRFSLNPLLMHLVAVACGPVRDGFVLP